MKATIEDLKDSFAISYAEFEASRKEAAEVYDLYHNRHYNRTQLAVLKDRGQPAETFNVVKMFTRMFVGYFSSVVNTIKCTPRGPSNVERAYLVNDVVSYILEDNDWDLIKDQLSMDMVLTGLVCIYLDVQPMNQKDDLGRPMYYISIEAVDPVEVLPDPMARKDDFSDSRFTHRFRWVSEEEFKALYGAKKLKKVREYYNFTGVSEADHTQVFQGNFQGAYRQFNNYLIVHTVLTDDSGKRWSVVWHDDIILEKVELKHNILSPYLLLRTNNVDYAGYYGLFREVVEPQKAINQAVIQIQLMANSKRVFAEEDAIKDVDRFNQMINRINQFIPVLDLNGIKIEDMTQDIIQQYTIIDKNLERIQRVLSINDSFLGQAMASDSGRKVKLQQNASVVALRYITNKLEFMYLNLGRSLVELVKQYYTATQIFAVATADSEDMQKFVAVNRPFLMPTGRMRGNQPEVEPLMYEVNPDRAPDEPIQYAYVNEADSDLSLADVRVKIQTAQYNDSDDIERMFLDGLLSGIAGQAMLNAAPPMFFQMAAMAAEAAKTRTSDKIAKLMKQVAQQLGGAAPTQDPRMVAAQQAAGGSAPAPMGGQMMHAAGATRMGEA